MVPRWLLLALGTVASASSSPVDKVIQLLSDLQAKVKKDGEVEAKAFKEFFNWCKDAAANTDFQIKTAVADQEKLEAMIGRAVADAEAAESVIEETARTIAAAEKDLEEATEIRSREHKDFKATESELTDAVDTLERAIGILQREMAKNPALLQQNGKNVQTLLKTLDTFVTAAGVGIPDRKKLLNLVQAQQAQTQESDDDDEAEEAALGAPQAASYKSQSGSIIDILEDMKEKAESELAEAQKAESNAAHNFAMVKQSVENEIKADTKEKTDAETTKRSCAEEKAKAEGDLKRTVDDLNNAKANKETVNTDCMTAAANQEASEKSRTEELSVLAKAKKIIQEGTQGAQEQTSFLQADSVSIATERSSMRSTLRSRADLKNVELVAMLKKLAKEQHSSNLAQLASRISATFRYGSSAGEDPFTKVKQLITDMIAKLQKEASTDADQKAYCDEEMAKNKDKKEDLSVDVQKLETRLDQATAHSTLLQQEVAQLSRDISEITRQQAEMDGARAEEREAYMGKKADLAQGVKAVQGALTMLREYYSKDGGDPALLDMGEALNQPSPPVTHSSADGAASGIISMLEVIESDFSKALAETEVQESTSQSEYDQTTQENTITKKMKEQDVKYKSQEKKRLDVAISEDNSELETKRSEMTAVLEYGDKLQSICVAKPESYEERKRRREAEIAGLREALTYLQDAAMLQRSKGHRVDNLLQRRKQGHINA